MLPESGDAYVSIVEGRFGGDGGSVVVVVAVVRGADGGRSCESLSVLLLFGC